MLIVPKSIVEETLQYLLRGGERNCETVVLWLGRRGGPAEPVEQVYRPDQEVDVDYFRIPSEAVRTLMGHLRLNRLQVLCQVHSHPGEAFHSKADDKWAIVRHVGALSLVVPYFARRTTLPTFFEDTATYKLDQEDRWIEVPTEQVLEIR